MLTNILINKSNMVVRRLIKDNLYLLILYFIKMLYIISEKFLFYIYKEKRGTKNAKVIKQIFSNRYFNNLNCY